MGINADRMPPELVVVIAAAAQDGYGRAVPEYRFHGTRKWRFDLAWPDYKVAFEREGGTFTGGRHTRGASYARDCEKYNAAASAGWCVIRATADMLRSGLALAQLLEALEART